MDNFNYIPAEYNTGVVRGDYFSEEFTFTIDNEALDISNANTSIQIRSNRDSIIGDYSLGNGLSITDNILLWAIEDTETIDFVPDVYKYDIEMVLDNVKKTFVRGRFTVERDTTT